MRYSRRWFLTAAALGVPGLAGCAGQEETPTPGPTTDGGQPTATPSPSATSTPTEETERPTSTEEPSTATETETPEPAQTDAATPTEPDTDESTGTDADTPTDTPPAGRTVVVGPDGTPQFDPEAFTISAGATVRWEWEDDGHNVRPSNTPEDSTWSGTPGGDDTTYDEGYTYENTFQVTGEYEYYCAPHRSLGMTGSFTVD